MAYFISQVLPSDRRGMMQVQQLLDQEGIRLDGNLDYACCVYDEDYCPVATGSCFLNTLRCFAVRKDRQGEGLLNQLISHLIQLQFERGNLHLFLYTKCESAKYFRDLGFYEIVHVEDKLVFMENRKMGFSRYIQELGKSAQKYDRIAAIVMNANPFTFGHQFLVEKAAAENDLVHLFIVSEDASLVPFAVRKKLVQLGTAHLPNVLCHDSGPYMISNATFPSYFLKDKASVIEGHARLDLAIFHHIAQSLFVTHRYVGEEPFSLVTGIYNQIMCEELPNMGIEYVMVPRKKVNGAEISASAVRMCIQSEDWAQMETLVPSTTLQYFLSPEGQKTVQRIQQAGNVVHY